MPAVSKSLTRTVLSAQELRAHRTSPQEINDLRAVVERHLADANIDALSNDRRFATAYNAVLQLTWRSQQLPNRTNES